MPRAEAVKHLTIMFEAIAENYAEYRDYNSTTTQSDRGELLYMLLDFSACACNTIASPGICAPSCWRTKSWSAAAGC